jgi:hypothetical protein
MVVVGADIFMFQEGEEFGFVTSESLVEPIGIFVYMVKPKDLIEAMIEPGFPGIVLSGHELGLSLGEPDGIFEQASQGFPESLPLGRVVDFIHLGQFGEQMIETPLLGQGADLVIGAPEIADEDSSEYTAQDFSDDRGAPALGYQVVAERLGGETPKPMGYAIEAPPGLIGAQYPALGDLFSDVRISGFQEAS